MTWDEKLHPRGDGGEFVDSWAAKVRARMGITPDRPPHALVMGYRRVGDHPTGAGRGHSAGGTMQVSTHPQAGGLWINPDHPGTRHAPRLLNDMGAVVTDMQPMPTLTSQVRGVVKGRRRGELRGRPDGAELSFTSRSDQVGGTSFGYGARGESATPGAAEAFVAHMKRAQPRARQDAARQSVRRTPRGTAVSPWMDAVNSQMSRTRG